jgi:hypothetical protein
VGSNAQRVRRERVLAACLAEQLKARLAHKGSKGSKAAKQQQQLEEMRSRHTLKMGCLCACK